MFGAITGVPEDLIATMPNSEDLRRDDWYETLLADPRMQATIRDDGTLQPVCESALASATPARRIAQAAQSFGRSGQLASICAPSWTQAIAPLLASSIALRTVGGVCLPRKPVRGADGSTQCHVTLTLPLPGTADETTPTSCSERASLRELSPPERTVDGRAVCELQQLAVTGLPDTPQLTAGEGWFFDDFSNERACNCPTGACNTVFFAPSLPAAGVMASIECFETRVLDGPLGDPASDAGACRVP
jgi:hypothetical protein